MRFVKSCGHNYLFVLVDLVHTSVTLIFSDDLAGILHNDLVCIEATVGANTKPSIKCLNDLYTHHVLAASTSSVFKVLKCPVVAEFTAE